MKTLREIGRTLYKWWMRFAHLLGFMNTRILLTITYFLLVGPTSLLMRLFGKDPLNLKFRKTTSFWIDREPREHSLENARHQF